MLTDIMPSCSPAIMQQTTCILPVRVLHVTASLFAGGMERAMIRLLENPSEEIAHDVCVLGNGDEAMVERCRLSVPTHLLHRGRWAWYGLRRITRSVRPHVVHARGTSVWMDAVLATRGLENTRLILSYHGRTDTRPLSRRRRWLNRAAAGRADMVVTVSHEAAERMHHEWSIASEKLCVIPNGVDSECYRPAESDRHKHHLRRTLGLDEDTVPVICVANLLPIKGLDVLLAAWRKVCLADRSAQLLIVGEGPLGESLRAQAERLRCVSRVRFLGRREDVPDLLRAAEIFVLPSRSEGSSNALLEAMAAGLPIVATEVGSNRELIQPNRTGWLVPPDDPTRMAEAILNTLFNPSARQRVGAAARAEVLGRFSLQQWKERYRRLYRTLAERNDTVGHRIMEEMICAE